jgi:hypothetical protein
VKARNQDIRLPCPIHDQNTFGYITKFAVNLTSLVGTIEDEERVREIERKKERKLINTLFNGRETER